MVARMMMMKYDLSQSEVASKLGVTQAAVSHYMKSKRGAKMASELEKMPEVKAAVIRISERLMQNGNGEEIVFEEFCGLCKTIRRNAAFWEKIDEILANR